MIPARSLARGRATAKQLMVDACLVKRADTTVFDEETGTDEPVYTTVYSGPCRVQAANVMAQSADVAGKQTTFRRLTVSIPVDTDPVAVDDVVIVVDSRFDPQLVGRIFRVNGVMGKSFATARRLDVEEVL